jgi:DNA-binding GntR family transcriptional regulator
VTRQPTRTEVVYDRLRDDIVTGTLAPGSKLRFAELNVRYGASMGVTREALSRLAEQGFVTSEPQLGFRVVSLSADDLLDLTETRCHIETQALAMAIEYGTVEWEASLLAAHHALSRTNVNDGVHPSLAPAWTNVHERFHEALIAGGPNVRLKSLATSLRANAEIYRSWSTNYGTTRSITDEHRALCEATLDRDRITATSLLAAHLVETARLLLDAAPDADESCLTRLAHIPTVCSTGAQLFAERTEPGDRSGR